MSDSIYKGVEIVGTSEQSFSQAIEAAVARARKTLHNLSWFVVKEMRGGLQQGRLQYQATLCVYFRLDELDEAGAAGDEGSLQTKRAAKGGANAAGGGRGGTTKRR